MRDARDGCHVHGDRACANGRNFQIWVEKGRRENKEGKMKSENEEGKTKSENEKGKTKRRAFVKVKRRRFK